MSALLDEIAWLARKAGGLVVLLIGAGPFVLAATLWAPTPEGVTGPTVGMHLWLTVTGFPDPLCGATRSFVLFVHGDGRFLDYNPVWIPVGLGVAAWGAVLTLRSALGRPLFGRVAVGPGALALRRPWLVTCAALSLFAVAWAVAIAHVDTIRDL